METSLLEDKSEQKEDRGGEALHVGPGGGRGTSEDAGMRRAGGSQDERLRDEGIPRTSLAWAVGRAGHRWRLPGPEAAGPLRAGRLGGECRAGARPGSQHWLTGPSPQCVSGPFPCFSFTSSLTGFKLLIVSQAGMFRLSPGPSSLMWKWSPAPHPILLVPTKTSLTSPLPCSLGQVSPLSAP